jgi:hypothetical protein
MGKKLIEYKKKLFNTFDELSNCKITEKMSAQNNDDDTDTDHEGTENENERDKFVNAMNGFKSMVKNEPHLTD